MVKRKERLQSLIDLDFVWADYDAEQGKWRKLRASDGAKQLVPIQNGITLYRKMYTPASLRQLFEQAARRLPSFIELHDQEVSFEPDENGNVEVSQRLSTKIGEFFNVEMLATGWIRLNLDSGSPDISARFDIVADRDGIRDLVYGHYIQQMHYDVDRQCWGKPYRI